MKVLVTTDFSAKSKAAIWYAMQWAKQQRIELIFAHVRYLKTPAGWSQQKIAQYREKELASSRLRLYRFINNIYQRQELTPGPHRFLILDGISPDLVIADYCEHHPEISCVCISTRGASNLNKILGTTTGNLIINAPVPVLAVPASYRPKSIQKILYASDFTNLQPELNIVLDFANKLGAEVEVFHLASKNREDDAGRLVSSLKLRMTRQPVKWTINKKTGSETVTEKIKQVARKSRSSLIILFTHKNRTILQKLFRTSQAESLSFSLKTPLLVFSKN